MTFTTVTVSATYLTAPGQPAAGMVAFKLTADISDGVTTIGADQTVTATLDDTGSFTVELFANDDDTTTPQGTQWLVAEMLSPSGQVLAVNRSYYVSLTSAQPTVNLAALAPSVEQVPLYDYITQQAADARYEMVGSSLPLPSGTPSAGKVPVATGSGDATVWGSVGGAVASVNGQTGAVVLTAAEVGADASGAAAAAQAAAEAASDPVGTASALVAAEVTRANGAYLALPSGTPTSGQVPVATGTGEATAWGTVSGGSSGAQLVTGSGNATTDATNIAAALAAMTVSGHITGTLKLVGAFTGWLDTVIDGGYSSVTQGANWTTGSTERFVLDAAAAMITPATTGAIALTVKGFYAPVVNVGFKGGGYSRSSTTYGTTASSATLTDSAGGFTAADVGRYVRVEGAGYLGQVPFQSQILSVQSTTSATMTTSALTAVSAAKGAVMSIALHRENLIDSTFDLYGNGFAGVLDHIDTQSSTAKYVTQSTLRSIKSLSCGQAQGWANVQGGVGIILDAWDDNSVLGALHDNCADVTIIHWETYNPSTQTCGLTISQPSDYAVTEFSFGDSATEAFVKIVGGDFGSISKMRTGGKTSITAGNGTTDGLKLVEVKSIDVDTLVSIRSSNGLHVMGGGANGIRVKRHYSQTADTVGLYVEAGPSSSAPLIDYNGHVRFNGNQAVYLASSLTGGRVKVAGYLDSSINQSGNSALYAVDCEGTATVLDVSGLTQALKGGGIAGGVHHVTASKLIGLDQARIGNGFAAEGTLWVADGAGNLVAVAPGTNGQIPKYNSSGLLVPGSLALAALSDVAVGSQTSNQVLSWNGTDWVPATLPSAGADPAGYVDPSAATLKSWAFDPQSCTTGKAPTNAKVYLVGIPWPTTQTVSNVAVGVITAGTSLTSGDNYLGLYDDNGNLLGTTADMSTAFASTGFKLESLVTPVSVTGGTGVFIYVAILPTATGTNPSFYALSSITNALVNAGWATNTFRQGQDGTIRTSLPSTLTMSAVTPAGNTIWAGVS